MTFSVFANNMEIAGKAAAGQSPAAFPDTCWTPPTAPPTPTGVPIPYPNTCFAKDTTNGSKTVTAHGKEIAMEGKSYFSTSVGDEPATMSLPKGLISMAEKGKCFFQMWSMNVKVEGSGVPRNMDIVTHNHQNPPNTGPFPYLSSANIDINSICKDENEAIYGDKDGKNAKCEQDPNNPAKWMEKSCIGLMHKPVSKEDCDRMEAIADKDECLKARKCQLVPFGKQESEDGSGCCPGQTGHHLMPDGMFRIPNPSDTQLQNHEKLLGILKSECLDVSGSRDYKPTIQGWRDYTEKGAPVVCAEGTKNCFEWGSHGEMHDLSQQVLQGISRIEPISYPDAKSKMLDVMEEKYKHCKRACIDAQLDAHYKSISKDENGNTRSIDQQKLQCHDGTSHNTGKPKKQPSRPKLQ